MAQQRGRKQAANCLVKVQSYPTLFRLPTHRDRGIHVGRPDDHAKILAHNRDAVATAGTGTWHKATYHLRLCMHVPQRRLVFTHTGTR